MSSVKIYESDTLAEALASRTKQYEDFEEKLNVLEKSFQSLVDNGEFKGKGADNIKSFYGKQIDVIKAWKDYIKGVKMVFSELPKMAADTNLAPPTKVIIPFLNEEVETGSQKSKEMVSTQHKDLEGILDSIKDIIAISSFSQESFETNMHKADEKKKETDQAVNGLDKNYETLYAGKADLVNLVPGLFMALMNATSKAGSAQPMNFNVKNYESAEIHDVWKEAKQSLNDFEKQQAEMQKIRDEIAAEKAKIEAEKARIEEEKNKPWYEKTWDGVKTFTGEVTGYYDSVRATTGVDPVTGRKLSDAERVAAGAMAAAGFIPVVGWAGRGIKGGAAIVKTAKGINTANHMLDAYKGTKAMDILNKTEKGIYGLYTANSAWEFGSGRDMFGNKLTEEQRQQALWNGLTMGAVGGAAIKIDRIKTAHTAVKTSKSHLSYYGNKLERFDFSAWENKSVSGKRKFTDEGLRVLNIREVKNFKKEMHANGISVKIDKKGILPNNVAAGFDPHEGAIYLRKKPTYLSATHEGFHAKQWKELGMEKYQLQTRIEKEEHVYKKIIENKHKYNQEEIYEAQRYIFSLRNNGMWPSKDWKGYDE
ncbi:transposase [Bacillus mangrovi]|uniref:Transposase n=1 Tax=Metabacillus mangrovi TaxID=1491830 RepID=A0A7X2V5N8_9BACI|nr:zincin-like metallopeptidase toxin domain-containing protein [Metabacillus mangrovi]MTH55002.1 transposase [Metabacillus mangrovi]